MKKLLILLALLALPSLVLAQQFSGGPGLRVFKSSTLLNQGSPVIGPLTEVASGSDSSGVYDIRGYNNLSILLRVNPLNAATTQINFALSLRFHTTSSYTDSTTYIWYPSSTIATSSNIDTTIVVGANILPTGTNHGSQEILVRANFVTVGVTSRFPTQNYVIPISNSRGDYAITPYISVKIRDLLHVGNTAGAIVRVYLLASN